MAMGFSSQTGPFRPSRPPLFRCSSSCLRFSSLASHSSHSFWDSSRKALHRQGDRAYHNVAGSLYNMVVSSSSSEFKQGSSCNTMSFEENYKQDNIKFYHPPTRWNLKVPTKAGNPPILFAQMLPDLPNQINSKGNSISSDFGSLQRPEEGKKIGGSDSSAAKHLWLVEGERLRGIRLRDMKMAAITNSGKVDIDLEIQKPSHEFNVKREENASSMPALINVDAVSCISIDAKRSQTDNNLGNSAQSNAGNGVPRISSSPHRPIGQLKFLSGKDKPHDRITMGCVLPKSDSAEQNYRTNNNMSHNNGCSNSEDNDRKFYRQTHKLSRKFNVKSEENACLVPALINGNASCMSTDAKVSHTDNNYRKSASPSKQISRNSPLSNAGDGIPQISATPLEPVSQEVIFSGNGKLHDSINKGCVVLKSASAEQNYRRNRNNNMSHNNADGHPVDSTLEQVLSSTRTFLEGPSSKRLAEEGEEINSKELDEDGTNVLQNNIVRRDFLNIASVKPGNRPTPLKRLLDIYDKVLVVDNISTAKEIVKMITNQYKHCVHACDTEVANIDVKQETPVDHGEIICFSIYSGPEADFGDGKSCVWVDVLDGGGKSILLEFAPFFEDPAIKKVWHNYSFDKHVIENYGLRVSGFHADTMHMARLWDSSRRTQGGYSLEALTSDPKVCRDKNLIGKVSMKTIFGRRKVKKDGSEGKIITIPPVEELQREGRKPWICYSALDSRSTQELYEYLKRELSLRDWILNGDRKGSMLDFYEKYWRPFGKLLVEMETNGMLVDRAYLAEVEKVAQAEQKVAAKRFRSWASKYCSDAKYMNVGSDAQLRQLFFGGLQNRKDPNESLPLERDFKVPNVEKLIEEGKKKPTKFRNIKLHRLVPEKKEDVPEIETEMYTATGWPSVSGDALKTLAGKVSAEFDIANDSNQLQLDDNVGDLPKTHLSGTKAGAVSEETESAYGTAYAAFGRGREGKEACHAIAALCDVCSIDSLISNFILPLQGSHISGKNGRIHCSLNINTETGRLSARRPNLQNQPALEKDRYKIRQAFIAAPGNSLIVADYGQLELRILAHLANCKSMLDAFKAGGDFHSRTAMNMYPHIREAVELKHVLLEWHPQPGEEKPPVPLLKDAFGSERRKAKMLNFSIAYGKTPVGLARDWKVSVKEAKETVNRWYSGREEVRAWQEERKKEAQQKNCVHTLLGRARLFPSMSNATPTQKGHIERAAINTPVQGSAADVAMCAMLEISKNARLKDLGWTLLLQVHDEVILEGPTESAEDAKAIVVECMSKPFDGKNILKVDLSVDAKCAQNWYSAK